MNRTVSGGKQSLKKQQQQKRKEKINNTKKYNVEIFILEVPEVSENMTGWNPMEEDYFSIRNSYNIDVDDPGVATTGYSKSEKAIKWASSRKNLFSRFATS